MDEAELLENELKPENETGTLMEYNMPEHGRNECLTSDEHSDC